jgi:putative two-component system response regulator
LKRILVVDDQMVSLKQISATLSGAHELTLAKSGEQALEMCEREVPQLILLDYEMPEMNGMETMEKLKSDSRYSEIPVIFLTGIRDSAVEAEALRGGAVDFINKPVDREILLHRIRMHLEYAAYQTSLQHTVKELEDNIVTSFAELVECRDNFVSGHVARIGKIVEVLGRALMAVGSYEDALTEDYLEAMVRAAPFHDIGKIGISDVILLKPGPLSDDEYDEIKKHTLIGGRLIERIRLRTPAIHYLAMARSMAEGHHENYNGTGYPRRLEGEAIPLCCRIISVANVYDACTSERVYRGALSHAEACGVIEEGSGTVFDPVIAEMFLKLGSVIKLQGPARRGPGARR